MADQVVLTLPDEISARAHQIAEKNVVPLEQVLIEHLKTLSAPLPTLSPTEQAELDALHHLSDDVLWTIAREQMPDDAQNRAHELMDKNSRGYITEHEYDELEKLVERGDRLMLRNAEAASILKSRGYPFTRNNFQSLH